MSKRMQKVTGDVARVQGHTSDCFGKGLPSKYSVICTCPHDIYQHAHHYFLPDLTVTAMQTEALSELLL